jgi:hypothetical protein
LWRIPARDITTHPVLLVLVFLVFWPLPDLISTPFTIYDIFVIEKDSDLTEWPKTFIIDKKGWLLGTNRRGLMAGSVVLLSDRHFLIYA